MVCFSTICLTLSCSKRGEGLVPRLELGARARARARARPVVQLLYSFPLSSAGVFEQHPAALSRLQGVPPQQLREDLSAEQGHAESSRHGGEGAEEEAGASGEGEDSEADGEWWALFRICAHLGYDGHYLECGLITCVGSSGLLECQVCFN